MRTNVKPKIYGLGYTGRTPEQIRKIAEEKNAVVLDIRFSPRSRNPQFAGSNIAASLVGRYQHVRDLGNRNYKGGPIDIVDFEEGRKIIDQIGETGQNVILMCMCKKPSVCHRTIVMSMLRQEDYETEELNAPSNNWTQLLLI